MTSGGHGGGFSSTRMGASNEGKGNGHNHRHY
jgi:hypothetical protein